jgi:hypothetical protein
MYPRCTTVHVIEIDLVKLNKCSHDSTDTQTITLCAQVSINMHVKCVSHLTVQELQHCLHRLMDLLRSYSMSAGDFTHVFKV